MPSPIWSLSSNSLSSILSIRFLSSDYFSMLSIFFCKTNFPSFNTSISLVTLYSSFLLIWYLSSDSLSSIISIWFISSDYFSILSIFFCVLNFPSLKTSIFWLLFLHNFYLSGLFHHSPCHHSYPSDLFHHIISQDSLYFSAKSIFAVSRLLYLYSMFLPCFRQSAIFYQITCNE